MKKMLQDLALVQLEQLPSMKKMSQDLAPVQLEQLPSMKKMSQDLAPVQQKLLQVSLLLKKALDHDHTQEDWFCWCRPPHSGWIWKHQPEQLSQQLQYAPCGCLLLRFHLLMIWQCPSLQPLALVQLVVRALTCQTCQFPFSRAFVWSGLHHVLRLLSFQVLFSVWFFLFQLWLELKNELPCSSPSGDYQNHQQLPQVHFVHLVHHWPRCLSKKLGWLPSLEQLQLKNFVFFFSSISRLLSDLLTVVDHMQDLEHTKDLALPLPLP